MKNVFTIEVVEETSDIDEIGYMAIFKDAEREYETLVYENPITALLDIMIDIAEYKRR